MPKTKSELLAMAYRGGAATAKRGSEFYRQIGKKGGSGKHKNGKHCNDPTTCKHCSRRMIQTEPTSKPTTETKAARRLAQILAELESK